MDRTEGNGTLYYRKFIGYNDRHISGIFGVMSVGV